MKNKSRKINSMLKKLCSKESGKTQMGAGQARDVLDKVAYLFTRDKAFNKYLTEYSISKALFSATKPKKKK